MELERILLAFVLRDIGHHRSFSVGVSNSFIHKCDIIEELTKWADKRGYEKALGIIKEESLITDYEKEQLEDKLKEVFGQ